MQQLAEPADAAELRPLPQPRAEDRAEGPQAVLQVSRLPVREVLPDGRAAARDGPADGAAARPDPGRAAGTERGRGTSRAGS